MRCARVLWSVSGGGLCGMVWYYLWMVGSWRLAPDGNDNVRPVNIESNFGPD